MPNKLRIAAGPLFIGLLIVASAAVAYFLAEGNGTNRAAGETINYRVCDTVFSAPPESLDLFAVPRSPGLLEPRDILVKLRFRETRAVDPLSGEPLDEGSVLTFDAASGEVITERIKPGDAELFEPVLTSKAQVPLDPVTAPWPYSDRTQVAPAHFENSSLRYRAPDPGAGLVISTILADFGADAMSSYMIVLANCRSQMVLERRLQYDGSVAAFVNDQPISDFKSPDPDVHLPEHLVHPDDTLAFVTFLAEFRIKN